MDTDFSDLVGDDLSYLGNLIAQQLSSGAALKYAKCFLKDFEYADGAALLDRIKPGDVGALEAFARLCLSSDCLMRVDQAIGVSIEEADSADWDKAYTIASPLISYMAENLDRYCYYDDLSCDELGRFLDEFNQDTEMFGGNAESPSCLMSPLLCEIVSILSNDYDAIDKYEHITITILSEIMPFGGTGAEERVILKDFRKYVKTMRDAVFATQLETISPTASQQRDSRSTFDVPGDADGFAPKKSVAKSTENPETALKEAMADLDCLIGLSGVKAEVKQLMNFLKIQQERRKHGLREAGQTLHFVFRAYPDNP